MLGRNQAVHFKLRHAHAAKWKKLEAQFYEERKGKVALILEVLRDGVKSQRNVHEMISFLSHGLTNIMGVQSTQARDVAVLLTLVMANLDEKQEAALLEYDPEALALKILEEIQVVTEGTPLSFLTTLEQKFLEFLHTSEKEHHVVPQPFLSFVWGRPELKDVLEKRLTEFGVTSGLPSSEQDTSVLVSEAGLTNSVVALLEEKREELEEKGIIGVLEDIEAEVIKLYGCKSFERLGHGT